MKTWYDSLSSRERSLVLVASIAILLLLLWLLAIKPLYNSHTKLNKVINAQKTTLATMKKQSLQIKRLQQQNSSPKINTNNQNPQQLIEKELQTWRLKPALERMQSQGPSGVRLVLKSANADRVMRFLFELENKYSLSINNLVISHVKKEPGLADIRLTIKKNQG